MAGFGPQIMPCPPEARAAALEVLYRRVPEALRYRLIVEVLDEAARGEIDLSGLWVARERAGRIVGALLTQPLAGKAAAVWAPEVKPSWRRPALAAGLIQAALADLKGRGFRLAQAVLDESAGPRAARDLTRGGMPRVTELLYLERDTALPLSNAARRSIRGLIRRRGPCACSYFEWQPFEPALEAEFRSVLQATYVGSLDMPELEGARALDDIMEGHRAAGRFDGRAIGNWDASPANRSRGRAPHGRGTRPRRLGGDLPGLDSRSARPRPGPRRAAARSELARTHVPRLELAVDCRNTPATRLYQSTGFVARDRRAVHLAILDQDVAMNSVDDFLPRRHGMVGNRANPCQPWPLTAGGNVTRLESPA